MYKSPDLNVKERRNYFITPTRDFTQYTKDCEEKYWNRETSFDWTQDVRENLFQHLINTDSKELLRITLLTLPMIKKSILDRVELIKKGNLPLTEDGLRDVAQCLSDDNEVLHKVMSLIAPLKKLETDLARIIDHIDILEKELNELKEVQKLGLIKEEAHVRHVKTEAEKEKQSANIDKINKEILQLQDECNDAKSKLKNSEIDLKSKVEFELHELENEFIAELDNNFLFVERVIHSKSLPEDSNERAVLLELILKRQFRGLRDIANHALVVEQSAIAPLTTGIIRYKRHREIQEAMTTFVNDEAKHSSTFRRFLAEKLEAKEFVSAQLITGANRYLWLARISPGTGMFMANIIEAIGASYLEFFSKEEVMPDKLFRDICEKISVNDERRHMDLCAAMYNELYHTGRKWEQKKNKKALKVVMKSVYGDKTEEHHLIEAFKAFGVPAEDLYSHVMTCLSNQLARIGLLVKPEELLSMIGKNE